MAPAKSLQHFRVLDYHLCNEFPIRILFWVPLLQKMQLVFFLGEGRFEIKVTSISFLHSKIKAMWIYKKISWNVKVFVSWQRHDFHLSCLSLPKHVFFWTTVFLTIFFQVILFVFDATNCFRCFTFKMFSIGRRCFWLIFFQVILSLFDVSCGTDPRIIRHRIHGHYKSVFFYVYYKFPNFKGGRCPLKLLS